MRFTNTIAKINRMMKYSPPLLKNLPNSIYLS